MSRLLLISLWAAALTAVAPRPSLAQGVAATSPGDALRALDSGLAARMGEAAQNLQPGGDRLTATRALDAARRLAKVEQSLVGCPASASSTPLKVVNAARQALQDGRAPDAAAVLRRASVPASGHAAADCAAGDSAGGKLLVNGRGDYIGRVVSVADGRAVLRTGGAINWLGFLDFGARTTSVSTARLVEGRQMVVLLQG